MGGQKSRTSASTLGREGGKKDTLQHPAARLSATGMAHIDSRCLTHDATGSAQAHSSHCRAQQAQAARHISPHLCATWAHQKKGEGGRANNAANPTAHKPSRTLETRCLDAQCTCRTHTAAVVPGIYPVGGCNKRSRRQDTAAARQSCKLMQGESR